MELTISRPVWRCKTCAPVIQACILIFLSSSKNRTILNFIRLTSVKGRLLPHSTQATVDLTNDLVAGKITMNATHPHTLSRTLDLFLTIDHQSRPVYQIHRLPITQLELIKEYDPPSQVALYHLSAFADIGNDGVIRIDPIMLSFFLSDGDGQLEHLLPVCMDADCLDSRIYVREHDQVSENSIERKEAWIGKCLLVVSNTHSFRWRHSISTETRTTVSVQSSTVQYENVWLQSRRLSGYRCGHEERVSHAHMLSYEFATFMGNVTIAFQVDSIQHENDDSQLMCSSELVVTEIESSSEVSCHV